VGSLTEIQQAFIRKWEFLAQKYAADDPEEADPSDATFEALNRVVLELNVHWEMFEGLYSDPEHLVTFNRTGANFWETIRELLVDQLMLSISRFFDPSKSLGGVNCSLETMIELPEVAGIKADLETRVGEMRKVWAPRIKAWRHKKLSHTDLKTALGVSILPEVTYKEIGQLVDSITAFSRQIQHHVYQRDIGYHCSQTGWTPQVIKYLQLGVEKRDEILRSARVTRRE
jgi:hypothetical protein